MADKDLTPAQRAAVDRMYTEAEDGTFYGLLEIDQDADANQIQAAYYELSRRWHPDRFFRMDIGEYADKIEMVFVSVTQAYKTLTDPVARKKYDRELRESGKAAGRASGLRKGARSSSAGSSAAASSSGSSSARASSAAADTGRSADGDGERPSRRRSGPSIRERLAQTSKGRPRPRRRAGATARLRRQMQQQIKGELSQQLRKARTFYETGKADYDAGKVIKASSALALAVKFDPGNEEYRALYDQVKDEARKARIVQLVAQGEQAESYQQLKQAIHAYRQAVELGPEDGKVYYRLSRLVRLDERDDRAALNLLRKAVLKSPDEVEYRLALGELYQELGLRLNARREYQAVLDLDGGHEGAKAALKSL